MDDYMSEPINFEELAAVVRGFAGSEGGSGPQKTSIMKYPDTFWTPRPT
jgi:DNA-binding response OmpR family regulator